MEGDTLFLADGDTLELCDRRLQSFLHDILIVRCSITSRKCRKFLVNRP